MFKRFWHELFGHPREQVYWGNAEEGAHCKCGANWYLFDMYPGY